MYLQNNSITDDGKEKCQYINYFLGLKNNLRIGKQSILNGKAKGPFDEMENGFDIDKLLEEIKKK